MAKYKVLSDLEIEGVEQKEGTEIELSEEAAAQLVTDNLLELVDSEEAEETEEEEDD